MKCRQRKIQKKKSSIETSKSSTDIKRDRFYGTIHNKTPMQMSDKIPGI
jgi:hypothetical protein